jgi:S1-C subfamily serine protease
MISRIIKTSGVVAYKSGYGINNVFKKYFTNSLTLREYLNKYSVYSMATYADRNFYNIDWNAYLTINGDLPQDWTQTEAIDHYMMFGQFETRELSFIKPELTSEELTRAGICSVFLKNKSNSPLCTGFLYDYGDSNRYLITCHHIIEDFKDQRYIYGIFENGDNTTVAQFVIVGYDAISDITVALYDYSLNYNVINNVDLTPYPSIPMANDFVSKVGDSVSLVGNIGFDDNLSFVSGHIMNTRYSGGFMVGDTVNTIPESTLIQTFGTHGMSGSPMLIGDPQGTEIMQCTGIMLGSMSNSDHIMIAMDGYLLDNIIQTIIHNWFVFTQIYGLTSQIQKDSLIKIGYPKAWLGITNQYFHPVLMSQYKELANLPYVGGLLVTNFIIGFNVRDESLVYSANELIDKNVIPLYGPLLKSTMYDRFTQNSNVPLVIKTISYFDSVDNIFQVIDIGKFGNQRPYSRYVYGQSPICSILQGSEYNEPFVFHYGPVTIDYYYYNGNVWQFDTETVGGNDSSWYNVYTDNTGTKYNQHLFEFPQILVPYIKSYNITKFASTPLSSIPMSSHQIASMPMSSMPMSSMPM